MFLESAVQSKLSIKKILQLNNCYYVWGDAFFSQQFLGLPNYIQDTGSVSSSKKTIFNLPLSSSYVVSLLSLQRFYDIFMMYFKKANNALDVHIVGRLKSRNLWLHAPTFLSSLSNFCRTEWAPPPALTIQISHGFFFYCIVYRTAASLEYSKTFRCSISHFIQSP